MILKGSQRGGGQDLASHLMRTDENEHVEIHDVRGFVSDALHGAFGEAHAISRATQCRKYLFSLSLNPPETEAVPVAAFEKTIAQIERKLGLEGQPRAIVFHEKEGRRHAHCVWSRIDAQTLTARPLPFFKTKLRDISRELYLEHGWRMPRGLRNAQARDPSNFTLAEWQQAKRTGQDPRVLKQALQECWAASDSHTAFQHAIEERGFLLARGDRRGHVVLDYTGDVHSLSRVLNTKTKDVRARLGDESELPSASDTCARIAERMTPVIKRHISEARTRFKHQSATLAHNKMVMVDRHRTDRRRLDNCQRQRREREVKAHNARLPRGFQKAWAWVTGRLRRIQAQNAKEAEALRRRDAAERRAMVEEQLGERRELQESIRTLRNQQAALLAELRCDVGRFFRLGRLPEAANRVEMEQRRRRTRRRSPS